MSKFIFNRYHLESNESITNKLQFLFDGLIVKSATSMNRFAYKFVEIEIKDNYIYGYLIKYDPYSIDEVFNEKELKVSKDSLRNKIVAKSLFIIDYKESLIIFEEISGHISTKTFIDRFKELFIENHKEKRKANIDISAIVDKYAFLNKVKDLKKVEKITLNLFPSNPRFNDRWKNFDERLRNNNINKYKEVQETNDPEGIIVDTETESKMMMSEDGYGKSIVMGIDKKNIKTTLSTSNRERTITLDVPKNIIEMGFIEIINFMNQLLEKIKNRTQNE
jgi:hypothetical protein